MQRFVKNASRAFFSFVGKEHNVCFFKNRSRSSMKILHRVVVDFVVLINITSSCTQQFELMVSFSLSKSSAWSCSKEKVYPFEMLNVIVSEKDDQRFH